MRLAWTRWCWALCIAGCAGATSNDTDGAADGGTLTDGGPASDAAGVAPGDASPDAAAPEDSVGDGESADDAPDAGPFTDAPAVQDGAADGTAGLDGSSSIDAGPDARLLIVTVMESGTPGSDGYAFAWVENPPFHVPVGPPTLVRGDCAYHPQPVPVPCEPECQAPTFCGFDGTCQIHEERFDAGPITIAGLKSAVTLVASGPYHYYSAKLDPEPTGGELFDAGSAITATGQGTAQFPPFTAAGAGVADLETPLPCALDPQPGEDLLITWTPGDAPSIRFQMQSGNHGEQFSRVVCETPDTGTLIVDGELLTLYLADWHPLESWRLSRTASHETTMPGARVRVVTGSDLGCNY